MTDNKEMRQLADKELDAVGGGFIPMGNVWAHQITVWAHQKNIAMGFFMAGHHALHSSGTTIYQSKNINMGVQVGLM